MRRVVFLISFTLSLISYSEIGHNSLFFRPLASFNDRAFPEKGIIIFDSFLAKPSFKTQSITPMNHFDFPIWKRDMDIWNEGLRSKLSRINNLLEKKDSLSSNSVFMLKIMQEKYLKAKNLFEQEFLGKSIVTNIEKLGVEEIEELFLSYCEALSNIKDETDSKEKIAHMEVLEKIPKHMIFLKLDSSFKKETLNELIKLRDYLIETGKFELFAEYFIKGYDPNFRKPWNTF